MASFKDTTRDKFSTLQVFNIIKKYLSHRFIGKLSRSLWIFIKSYLKDYLINYNEPKVVRKINCDGCEYFKVYDPVSNYHYYFSTEKEVMIWLERRYYC